MRTMYCELNLKKIREDCDLDFARYTYSRGQCSCCYSPKDMPALYWRNRTIPENKYSYQPYTYVGTMRVAKEEVDYNEYTYLLFKNACNGSGIVTKSDYIVDGTCIEWGFPMAKLDKVCAMLKEQLGDDYSVEKPENHSKCITIHYNGRYAKNC